MLVPPRPSVDALARITRDPWGGCSGHPGGSENRAGAGGSTGAGAVANAAPDGYTLLVTVNAPITMNTYLQKSIPFDPRRSFAPVTLAAETSLLLAVHPSLPVNNVAELLAHARTSTGKLSYGSAGVGSGHHITGESGSRPRSNHKRIGCRVTVRTRARKTSPDVADGPRPGDGDREGRDAQERRGERPRPLQGVRRRGCVSRHLILPSRRSDGRRRRPSAGHRVMSRPRPSGPR